MVAGVESLLILLVSSAVLDRGVTYSLTAAVTLAFWIAVIIILIRRWRKPTLFDLGFLYVGYPILVVVVVSTFVGC